MSRDLGPPLAPHRRDADRRRRGGRALTTGLRRRAVWEFDGSLQVEQVVLIRVRVRRSGEDDRSRGGYGERGSPPNRT
jgi:hypothetical protein